MSMIKAEGFAHYTTVEDWGAKGNNDNGGASMSFHPTNGRGGRGVATIGLNSNIAAVLPSSEDIIFCHIAIKTNDRDNAQLLSFRNASCDNVYINSLGDGSLQILRADGAFGTIPFLQTGATSLYTTNPFVFRNDTWHQFQVECKIHASTGIILIKVDGIEVANLTGINTYSGTGAVATSQVGMGTNGGQGTVTFSDLVVCNDSGSIYNTFLGDVAVYETVSPIDGDLLQWDRSVASGNWSDYVDDNPQDEDTTYLVSNATDERVCFSFPVVSSAVGTVLAVKETVCHRKEDPATAILKLFSRSSDDVNHDGTEKPCTESYIFDERIYELDLKDNTSWTVAKVNATQLGVLNSVA